MQNALLSSPVSLQVVDGHPTTTSIDVARYFCKRHGDVIRAIRQLGCSQEFAQRNFASCSRKADNGRAELYYQITRDGFSFLCMGFTGPQADKWKEAYIHAFNEMEKALAVPPQAITPAQQNALQQIIKRIAGGDGKRTVALWSRFNNHFRLGSYKQLPADSFADAVTYLEGLTGEYLPKQDKTAEDILKQAAVEYLGRLRFMFSLDINGYASMSIVPGNAFAIAPEEIPKMIEQGTIKREMIPAIIEACARGLTGK